MSHATTPIASVQMTPVVSWPHQARPGGRYLVTIDLRLDDIDGWPYSDEEHVVALMLSGRDHLKVNALGDTSVVLHRFGGTYGPARFVTTVGDAALPSTETSLWLTLISAGGVPFHTVQLPILITIDAPMHPSTMSISLRDAALGPPMQLPSLAGTDADVWSMVAFNDAEGRPALAIGTDIGTLRVWWPANDTVDIYKIAPGRAHVTPLRRSDGTTLLLAASSRTFLLLDPATRTVLSQLTRPDFETVTALATIDRAPGAADVAVGTSSGAIYLLQDGQLDIKVAERLIGHVGAVFSMASITVDGRSLLASAGRDSAIRIWDTHSRSLLGPSLTGHVAQINSIAAVAGEGGRSMIVSAADDGTVRVWDVVTGTPVGEPWLSNGDWVNAVIELPEGTQRPVLLWGGREGILRWALQGATRSSAAADSLRPVTTLISFTWAGRPVVAIARAGGDVTLRYGADFQIDESMPTWAPQIPDSSGILREPLAVLGHPQRRQQGRSITGVRAVVVAAEDYHGDSTLGPLDGPALDAARYIEWLRDRGVPDGAITLVASPLTASRPLIDALGLPARPATQAEIYDLFAHELPTDTANLLIVVWGGHGAIDGGKARRLFTVDATMSDQRNLDFDSLSDALLTSYYPAFQRQLLIVDACQNLTSELRYVNQLPRQVMPRGNHILDREQHILFAAAPGQVAMNDTRRKTGLFSDELLRLLQDPAAFWPPDADQLAQRLDTRFATIRAEETAVRQPPYLWRRTPTHDGQVFDLTPAHGRLQRLSLGALNTIVSVMEDVDELCSVPNLQVLIGMLPSPIRAAVPYSDVPRTSLIQLLRTCDKFAEGRNALTLVLAIGMADRQGFASVSAALNQHWPAS
ncbi:hypothetical protein AB0B66_42705 [Catellatospora sp. NPDC049111]|uniref:effector-associated domain 2-containing protein n=1 Tax=Catellatospora sp. NPDC049111 TaxID=3155271 RepID=UPI0033C92F71